MSQRYAAPLRAVDEVAAGERDGVMVVSAGKDITGADPYLQAHFPGRPVYPGVFVLETVRQAMIEVLGERDGMLPDVVEVHSMRFLRPLLPGDRLCVTATVATGDPNGANGSGGADDLIRVDARCERADGAAVARLQLGLRYEH